MRLSNPKESGLIIMIVIIATHTVTTVNDSFFVTETCPREKGKKKDSEMSENI